MLNEIITWNFVSHAGSLRSLAEGLQHCISIRLPCDARNLLLMQSNKDTTVVNVYIWSNICLEQHADNGTSIQHDAIRSAVTSSQAVSCCATAYLP